MEDNELHFCHLMLFYFWKSKNAVKTAKILCAVYCDGTIAESTDHKLFARNFNLDERERSARPAVADNDQSETLIKSTDYTIGLLQIYSTYPTGMLQSI